MRIFLYVRVKLWCMSGESQLTFDDVLQPETPDELYSVVSAIADRIVAEERVRSGDNCATISQRHTDTDEEFVFCVQLPPRTNSFSVSTFENIDNELTVDFVQSAVDTADDPPYVTWEFVGNHPLAESVTVLIVKPIEEMDTDEEEDEEGYRELYTQFDFTRFVRDKDNK